MWVLQALYNQARNKTPQKDQSQHRHIGVIGYVWRTGHHRERWQGSSKDGKPTGQLTKDSGVHALPQGSMHTFPPTPYFWFTIHTVKQRNLYVWSALECRVHSLFYPMTCISDYGFCTYRVQIQIYLGVFPLHPKTRFLCVPLVVLELTL